MTKHTRQISVRTTAALYARVQEEAYRRKLKLSAWCEEQLQLAVDKAARKQSKHVVNARFLNE